jgi:hypothetical protein
VAVVEFLVIEREQHFESTRRSPYTFVTETRSFVPSFDVEAFGPGNILVATFCYSGCLVVRYNATASLAAQP